MRVHCLGLAGRLLASVRACGAVVLPGNPIPMWGSPGTGGAWRKCSQTLLVGLMLEGAVCGIPALRASAWLPGPNLSPKLCGNAQWAGGLSVDPTARMAHSRPTFAGVKESLGLPVLTLHSVFLSSAGKEMSKAKKSAYDVSILGMALHPAGTGPSHRGDAPVTGNPQTSSLLTVFPAAACCLRPTAADLAAPVVQYTSVAQRRPTTNGHANPPLHVPLAANGCTLLYQTPRHRIALGYTSSPEKQWLLGLLIRTFRTARR